MVRAEPLSKYGNHSPYRVRGKVYTVLPTAQGYEAEGVASWYGPNFHGKKTSNQEVFDMHELSAAHRSLPLPTYVRVTNLKNDKSVIVRVNDRGPFVGNRLIDMSFAAAKALDFVNDGVTPVRVTALEPTERLVAQPVPQAEHMYLQVAAFSAADNAVRLAERLSAEGIPGVQVFRGDAKAPEHKVRIGPLAHDAAVEDLAARIAALGLPGARVVFE